MNQQYPLESIPVKLEEVVENIEVSEAKTGPGQPRRYRLHLGYKLYLLLDADTGEVLGLELKTANCNESPVGRELLKGLPKAKGVALADAAYDAAANFRTALVRGYHLLTSTNPRRGEAKQAPRQLNAQTMRRPEMKALFKSRCPSFRESACRCPRFPTRRRASSASAPAALERTSTSPARAQRASPTRLALFAPP